MEINIHKCLISCSWHLDCLTVRFAISIVYDILLMCQVIVLKSVLADPEIVVEGKGDDEDNAKEDEAERMRKEELVGKVLQWFLDQLNQYSDEEKDAIKACAIAFVNDGTFSKPTVSIQNNELYSHERLIELCSAFYLIGKPKDACVSFAKQVFAIPFANTEERTISRKIKGANTMLVLIDTYWEAKGIYVRNM